MPENSVNRGDSGPILAEAALLFGTLFLPGALMPALGTEADMTAVLAQTVVLAVPQFLLMVHVAGLRGDGMPASYGLSRPRPRDVLAAVAAAMILFAVSGLLSRLLAGGPASGYRWRLSSPWQIPLALAAGLASGYREEFFFRPYLLRRLARAGAGTAVSVLLSTALFASCHVYEGAGGILLAVLQGIGFSALFLRVPSLHLLALAHGLYNAAALAASLAPGAP